MPNRNFLEKGELIIFFIKGLVVVAARGGEVNTDRAVLIRYKRGAASRHGSGLRVGGRFVLTAAHCAKGTGHTVVVSGKESAAKVLVCSDDPKVDLAILEVSALPGVDPLGCALVDRTIAERLLDCQALGFPAWKQGPAGTGLVQADGYIPTAEGIQPGIAGDFDPLLTLKITSPQIRDRVVPADLEQSGSPWAGMSGAVVIADKNLVVGVIRSHSPAEGVGSLTFTPLAAIMRLDGEMAARFWKGLNVEDPSILPLLPATLKSRYMDAPNWSVNVYSNLPRKRTLKVRLAREEHTIVVRGQRFDLTGKYERAIVYVDGYRIPKKDFRGRDFGQSITDSAMQSVQFTLTDGGTRRSAEVVVRTGEWTIGFLRLIVDNVLLYSEGREVSRLERALDAFFDLDEKGRSA